MKILLDSADINEIEKWSNYIVGITTNPKLLKQNATTIEQLRDKLPESFLIFHQITGLYDPPKNVVLKVPLLKNTSFNGFNLLYKGLKDYKTMCSTMMYDLFQLNYAMDLGVDYSIVLMAKNNNPHFLEEAITLKEKYNYKTQLIAASFRTKNDVLRAINSGVDMATIPPNVLELCMKQGQAKDEFQNTYGN